MNVLDFFAILWKDIESVFKMDELSEPMEVEMVPVTDDVKNVDSEQTDVKPLNSNNMQVPEVKKH